MTPQERELLTNLIDRLRQAPAQAKDREADQLISDLVRERPDAAYVLAQTVLIQDYSLHQAQARITELESQPPAANAGAGSFLGGLFGRSQPAAAPAPAPQSAGGPWGNAAAAAPAALAQAAGGGGSFLRSAAATAAGVAGGALLFSGIQSLFGHGLGGLGGFGGQAFAAQPSITETVINNYGGSDPASTLAADPGGALDPGGLAGDQPIPDFTPATDDLASNDAGFDPGGDFGGDFGSTDV